jgi:hypothetical protein
MNEQNKDTNSRSSNVILNDRNKPFLQNFNKNNLKKLIAKYKGKNQPNRKKKNNKKAPKKKKKNKKKDNNMKNKEKMLGAAHKETISINSSEINQLNENKFQKKLNPMSSTWEYVENEGRQKEDLRINENMNSSSSRFGSKITKKQNNKKRIKRKKQGNKGQALMINIDEQKKDFQIIKEESNRRKSYRTRESILSIDKNSSNDLGKLSHHTRQIFKYMSKKEVRR